KRSRIATACVAYIARIGVCPLIYDCKIGACGKDSIDEEARLSVVQTRDLSCDGRPLRYVPPNVFLVRALRIAGSLRLNLVVDDEYVRRPEIEEVAIEKLELAIRRIGGVGDAVVGGRQITADITEILVQLVGHDLIDSGVGLTADAAFIRALEIAEIVEEERVGQGRLQRLQRPAEDARTAVDRIAVDFRFPLPVRSADQ